MVKRKKDSTDKEATARMIAEAIEHARIAVTKPIKSVIPKLKKIKKKVVRPSR